MATTTTSMTTPGNNVTSPGTTVTTRSVPGSRVAATGVTATPAITTNNVMDTISSSQQDNNDINTMEESNTECQINLKDYDTVRGEIKKEIDSYYNKILGTYSENYEEYLEKITSNDQDDVDFANTQLKPKVIGYNKQLIKINKELIKRVNEGTKMIDDQKNNLQSNRDEINNNHIKIDKLEEKRLQLKTQVKGNNKFLKEIEHRVENDNIYKYVYVGINLLLLIMIIGGLVYLLMEK